MNRWEFMAQLEQQLSRVAEQEKADALAYYNEYFDEAGPENEARVIEELGSPEKVAAQIRADIAVKAMQAEPQPQKVKRGISTVWIVLLGILALPIALPLAIAAVAVVISLLAAGFSVVVALLIAVIAVLGSGVVSSVAGIAVMFSNFSTGIFYLGAGFAAIGIAMLMGVLVFVVARLIVKGIASLLNMARKRGQEKHGVKSRGVDDHE